MPVAFTSMTIGPTNLAGAVPPALLPPPGRCATRRIGEEARLRGFPEHGAA